MQELVRLRQQQQATDHQLQIVGQRVQVMEQRQQQMMSFLAKAMQSPGFLNQLVQQQNENNRRIARGSKKRRLAGEEEENSVGRDGNTFTEGQIVKFHSSMNEAAKAMMHQILKMNSSPMLEPSINNSTPLLIGNTPSSSTVDSSSSSSQISGLTLSEVPAVGDSSFLPVESRFPANHVSTANSEVQSPPYLVTDQVKTNYCTEKHIHNPGQVTPVLNSSEMSESSIAISNTTFVWDKTRNAEYIHSVTPALDVTITEETDVPSPDQNVDILVDAMPRLPSINDAFWEQILAAGDTDEIHPIMQESSVSIESELISWEENGWNKVQQMNHLTEQMGLLTSEGKRG
uniref:Heat shock transcription factor A1d n=1 Tax=Rhizophora mucronata TaxID=61149 RepID=A0A2P2JHT6_RHIMU